MRRRGDEKENGERKAQKGHDLEEMFCPINV